MPDSRAIQGYTAEALNQVGASLNPARLARKRDTAPQPDTRDMSEDTSTRRDLASADDCRAASLDLLKTMRRSLALFTRDLEPAIYGSVEFATSLQRLALRSRFTHIRVVVVDPGPAIRDGHRLVELARRLPSFMEFRRPGPEHARLPESFLVVDETGFMYRPLASRYEGSADTANGLEARKLLKQFAEIWSLAEPEQEFRRLGL
ncbi:MAG TPA: hypothetical protein VFM15_01155 [Gammaproteobacteria bacterium]|nr:hypothetical protein [Gammaproteobacteria bacterium]